MRYRGRNPLIGPVWRLLTATVLVVGGLLPRTGEAQRPDARTLESEVRRLEGGVAFRFALRPDIEVCENGIRMGEDQRIRWNWRDGAAERRCSTGLAEAVLEVRDAEIRAVDVEPWEGPGSTPAGRVDLGRVATSAAASFLVSLARSGRDEGEAARDAMMVASLADSVQIWPELLEVARERSLEAEVRRSAVFWVGQAAAAAATSGLAELARSSDEEQGVRDAAVFALSQRPDDEALPILMELARDAAEAETRRTAMFWLAQSGDERVLAFFESILLGEDAGGG